MAAEEKGIEEKGKKAGDALIAEACKAYGIDPKYVFASRYDAKAGQAIILTQGGSRVRYKTGDKANPLPEIAVTGINPEWAKCKVIAGKGKK